MVAFRASLLPTYKLLWTADPRFTIYPLSRAIIDRSNGLTADGEMHDRQIVATALVLSAPGQPVALLTHDQNITDFGSVRWNADRG